MEVGVGLPVTVAATALKLWPTLGVPVMVAPEMVGAVALLTTGTGAPVTVAVAALVALAEPALLVSVMVTVRVWPTSPALTT